MAKRRGHKERFELTSTVTVVKPGATHTTEYKKKPSRVMSFEVDVLFVTIIVAVVGIAPFMIVADRLWNDMLIGLVIDAAVAAVVFFWRLRKLDNVRPEIVESHNIDETAVTMALPSEVIEEETIMPGLLVQIPGSRGVCEFYQPRVMEFATWIRTVLQDEADPALRFNQQVNLSKRTATERRNWQVEMYDDMLEQLYEYRLVVEGPNRIPVPTDAGKHYFKIWLTTLTPPPSEE